MSVELRKSQTPFGCWSDQDKIRYWEIMILALLSQTPFGCWSDQDTVFVCDNCGQIALGHKRLSAVGPIRTIHEYALLFPSATGHKRLSAVGPIRTKRARKNAIKDSVCHKRLSAVGPIRTCKRSSYESASCQSSQTPFGCWSDQD